MINRLGSVFIMLKNKIFALKTFEEIKHHKKLFFTQPVSLEVYSIEIQNQVNSQNDEGKLSL